MLGTDRNYLYRVLGLSALPRVVTFSLTLLSFPILLRGMGAAEYGVMVYLTSLAAILELVAGFGVGAAAGKALADCRTHRPKALREELLGWMWLQFVVCLISAAPVYAIGLLVLHLVDVPATPSGLLGIVVATLYVQIFVGVGRTILSSMLAFRRVAILDTVESIVRPAGWLYVGLFQPTAWALAWASAGSAMVALALCATLIAGELRPHSPAVAAPATARRPAVRSMLRESVSFLALNAGTRAFNSLPVLLIGRLFGYEVTGVLGAFVKVMEIVSLPFTVLGNALMYRAPEIKRSGLAVLSRYWDMLFRLAVIAFAISVTLWFGHVETATILLPSSTLAADLFVFLPPCVLARCVADLFAPASDYVGGLRSRVMLLWACALAQVPVIWLAAGWFGSAGAVAAMVAAYGLMVGGYLVIAAGVFFGRASYRVPSDFVVGGLVTALVTTVAAVAPLGGAWRAGLFLALTVLVFAGVPSLRRSFAPARLIRFDFT